MPDGAEIGLYHHRRDADKNHRSTGTRPAQTVLDGRAGANDVINDVETTQ